MPDYTKIQREFPDYPVTSIPDGIPNWLEPIPWHNDTCPIWGDERYLEGGENGIALAIDYPDPGRREIPEAPRFSAFSVKDGEQAGDTFSSDDWEATLAELRRRSMEDSK